MMMMGCRYFLYFIQLRTVVLLGYSKLHSHRLSQSCCFRLHGNAQLPCMLYYITAYNHVRRLHCRFMTGLTELHKTTPEQ